MVDFCLFTIYVKLSMLLAIIDVQCALIITCLVIARIRLKCSRSWLPKFWPQGSRFEICFNIIIILFMERHIQQAVRGALQHSIAALSMLIMFKDNENINK